MSSATPQNDFIDYLNPDETLETLNSITKDIPNNCSNSKSHLETNNSCGSEHSLKIEENEISENVIPHKLEINSDLDPQSKEKPNDVSGDSVGEKKPELKIVDTQGDESFENICVDLEQMSSQQQPDIVEVSERSSSPVLGRNRSIVKKTLSSPILGRKTSASQMRSITRRKRNSQASETRLNNRSPKKSSSPVKSSNKITPNKNDETWDSCFNSFVTPDTVEGFSLMEGSYNLNIVFFLVYIKSLFKFILMVFCFILFFR